MQNIIQIEHQVKFTYIVHIIFGISLIVTFFYDLNVFKKLFGVGSNQYVQLRVLQLHSWSSYSLELCWFHAFEGGNSMYLLVVLMYVRLSLSLLTTLC